MPLLLTWAIAALAFIVAANVVPGVEVKGLKGALFASAIYGLFTVLIGWLLWTVLTIGTLGLALVFGFITRWIVATIVLKVTDAVSDSITLDGFVPALLTALIVAGSLSGVEWVYQTIV